ncbi:MAG TPA: DNA translocase FtsK 4TM domain-containing protein [Polyangiales bacterium]|nr:DNA translocase FtsK 4TM domain-containing protein [Polyangiales bacterium]
MDSKLGRRHEILGILCFAAALLCALALCSYDVRGGENWVGPLGENVAGALVQAFGYAALVLPVELLLASLYLLRLRPPLHALPHLASVFVYVLLGCAFAHLAMRGSTVFGGALPGGVLGEVLGEVLRSLLGLVGAYVVCIAALAITFILRTSFSLVGFLRSSSTFLATHFGKVGELLARGVTQLMAAWSTARAIERRDRDRTRPSRTSRAPRTTKSDRPSRTVAAKLESPTARLPAPEERVHEAIVLADDEDDEPEAALTPPPEATPANDSKKRRDNRGPTIVAPKVEARRDANAEKPAVPTPRANGPFMLPPSELLAETEEGAIEIDERTLKENALRLVEKLEAYGVSGRVDEIHPGPVVTMYEFEPQSGTKISKIAGLSDDLAMALAAQKVRIVAPIPGKARVGFELPNEIRQTVYLRELLEDDRWQKLQSALPLAFGKDIVGQPVYGDLSKMPHLLVAGATGSGKSVGLNVMLVSLLMKKSPDDVRLLMIDPKVVELAVFDGIPHMLLPVVTDMKKASLALRWAVDEMERRYQLFADAGARNLATYNGRVDKVKSGELSVAAFAPRRAGKVRALGENGEELLLDPSDGERSDAEDWQPERLPSIVLVVDEFADLMMVAAKDVESAIARLAQKARAAGIHVILATQRPSVDVITGMIKANFPSRIGYKVSQREDSKTILGRSGAEHLLGLGDMLTLLPGSNDLKRVHSAYISEDEVKAVCDFLRAQGMPVYDDNILKPRDDEDEGEFGVGAPSDDPLYDRAVAIVAQAGYCSISHIQRNLSVGYNKAAKLVERMEKEGVVGPASGKAGGRREVFIEAR